MENVNNGHLGRNEGPLFVLSPGDLCPRPINSNSESYFQAPLPQRSPQTPGSLCHRALLCSCTVITQVCNYGVYF